MKWGGSGVSICFLEKQYFLVFFAFYFYAIYNIYNNNKDPGKGVSKKIVVLASEPVGGRSWVIELPCFPKKYVKCK